MLYFFNKIISLMITVVMLIGVTSNGAPAHTVLDEDACKLCATVLSDVHIEGNNLPCYNAFGRIIKDVKNNSFGNDAVIFLGDSTMNGQNIESLLFYGLVGKTNVSDNVFVSVGNHDVGNGEGDYDRLLARFEGYNNAFFGKEISGKPYYYRVVNGYYFIFLGPEELCVHNFPISDEQISFLDEALSLATADGKPAFICCHYTPRYADDAAEQKMLDVIEKYKNVFYFYGHTHWPLDSGSFENYYSFPVVNLPRCTQLYGENGREVDTGTGDGIQLEIYEDEVVVRGRNFYRGEWHSDLERHYKLAK